MPFRSSQEEAIDVLPSLPFYLIIWLPSATWQSNLTHTASVPLSAACFALISAASQWACDGHNAACCWSLLASLSNTALLPSQPSVPPQGHPPGKGELKLCSFPNLPEKFGLILFSGFLCVKRCGNLLAHHQPLSHVANPEGCHLRRKMRGRIWTWHMYVKDQDTSVRCVIFKIRANNEAWASCLFLPPPKHCMSVDKPVNFVVLLFHVQNEDDCYLLHWAARRIKYRIRTTQLLQCWVTQM